MSLAERKCGYCGRPGALAAYTFIQDAARLVGIECQGPYLHLSCAKQLQGRVAQESQKGGGS